MRTALVLAVLVVGAVVVPPAVAADAGADAPASTADGLDAADNHTDDAPPDPDEDVLGWHDGYWYNESVDVTPEDGLNESELDAVVARGMARVEHIRRLNVNETPPVEVISREEYRERNAERFNESSDRFPLHQNVKYEALFMVGENTDAYAVQEQNFAAGTLGYYDPERGNVVIVSENATTPRMDELTLAHELFHAHQDERFNTSAFNRTTVELDNARNGLIEGDANYIEYLYQQRCDEDWDCVVPSSEEQQGGGDRHLGMAIITLQPYSDGPAFVQEVHESEGWEGVNALYEQPPESTEQTIHTEKYLEDSPTNVTVEDRSNDSWQVLNLTGPNTSVNYASFGEAGMFAMLWYPGYVTQGRAEIVSFRNFLNFQEGTRRLQEINPYNYSHPYTAGWDGDRLMPYVTTFEESSRTNETGYVWKTAWDSQEDAQQFRDAYEQVLSFHGGESVPGREDTFRIPESGNDAFQDAFYVAQQDQTVIIVNAPSVGELSAIREGAGEVTDPGELQTTTEPTPGTPTDPVTSPSRADSPTTDAPPNDTPDPTTTAPATDTPTPANSPADGGEAGGLPGFGPLVALLALLGAVLLGRRR